MKEDDKEQDKPIFIHLFPFRFVQPYPYTYRTFAKGRWVGNPLLPTLVKEFKAYPPQYYKHSIQTGQITVNHKQTPPEYILKNGDEIIHVSLRVEPPVLDLPIGIVAQTPDYLVVNKPPSIIVHTGGGHHFNTIQNLLKYEYHYTNLHVLHRLDKCTSGLLIFAKDKTKVGLFHQESGKQIMKKMYYARVGGNFEWNQKQLSAYIQCLSHKDGVYRVTEEIKQEKGDIKEGEQPKEEDKPAIKKEEQNAEKWGKKGKMKENDLKDSKTFFRKVWYDSQTDSSLLQCYPVTGRTHQIRVHLQFLGYPILNDVVYGGRFVGNKIIDEIKKEKAHQQEEAEGKPQKKVKMNEEMRVQDWDFTSKSWQIMLHSFRYKFGGHQFQTEVPYWFFKQNIDPKTKQ